MTTLAYDMDTLTSDGKMRDLSPSGVLHGTVVGTTDVDGMIGRARHFPGGANTDNVSPGDVLDFGTAPFTVTGWIRTTSFDSVRVWAGKWSFSGGGRGWGCYFSSGFPVMEIEANGTSSSAITGSAINDGRWHYITCVFNRNGSTQAVLSLYVDGALVAGPTTFTGQNGTVDNTNVLTIGNASTLCWDGDLDEIQIFDRALVAAEVLSQYADAVVESRLADGTVLEVRDAFGTKLYLRPEVNEARFDTRVNVISIPSGEDVVQTSGPAYAGNQFEGYILFVRNQSGWDTGTWDGTCLWDAVGTRTGIATHQLEMLVASGKIRSILRAGDATTVRLVRNHAIVDSWTGRPTDVHFAPPRNRTYRMTLALERA